MCPSERYGPLGLNHGRDGFTLMELLVVMVLVGLLSSLVFLSVASGVFSSQEERFVRRFGLLLKRARTSAMGQGRMVRFVIDGEKRLCGQEDRPPEEIPEGLRLQGDGLVALEDGRYALFFFPDGSSSGGIIDIDRENGRRDTFKIGVVWGRIEHEVSH